MASPDLFPPAPSEEEVRDKRATALARPKFPPSDSISYRAGLLAGLREAAEKCDAEAADGCNLDEISAYRYLAKEFRARIAALEEEKPR